MTAAAMKVLFGTVFILGSVPAVSQSPLPPPRVVKFFNPTLREHSLSAECGEGSASVVWTFDGQNATLRTFTLGGQSLSPEQLAQIQAWMSEIGGDILIDLECNGDATGVAAGMRLLNAQSAGSAVARAIRAYLVDGALSEFARYNFDGKRMTGSEYRFLKVDPRFGKVGVSARLRIFDVFRHLSSIASAPDFSAVACHSVMSAIAAKA